MEKKFELMKDKNGRTMRTGDIVKIENAFFKNDNGYYFIAHSPGDVSWDGSGYSLKKIGKRGKISTAKYNIAFWPLSSYCTDQRKNRAADEHNKDDATIEIVDCIDNAEVIAHFKEEAEKAREQAHYYEARGYDWEKWVKVYSDTADHYEKVIERISSSDITDELTVEPETPTETTQKPQKEPESMAGDTSYTYFTVTNEDGEIVDAGKVESKSVGEANAEARKAAEKYIKATGKKAKYSAGGCYTPVAEQAKEFLKNKELEKATENAQEEKTTETAPEAEEMLAKDEAEEINAEDAETAGNGTDEPQKELNAGIIGCAIVKDKTAEENNLEFDYKLILYKNEDFYGFGFPQDTKSFYGFPVNQCGDIEEVKESLGRWIAGDYTSKSEKEACRMFLEILRNEPMEKHSKSQETPEGGITATPSMVSKSDTEETPEENSGTPSGDSKNYTMGSDNTEGKSDTPSGDEKSYTAKTVVKYYEISEETARRAHEMMSFRDYKENSATDEYRASVDRAAEIVEKQKRKVSPYYHAKIDALLDKYARRLAEWTNACNRNRASCPSVMICGPANFPTKKKEKQNSREDTLWKEYEDIKGILDKITSIGTGAIDLADPHARELLQERLDNLKKKLELDKKLNAYWKKHKTFIGCPDISADFAEKLTKETNDMFERCAWMSKPFPDYNLASIRDKIKRTQARLDQLNTMQEKANDEDGNTETFDGGEIFRNYEQNRLQIIFNEKPDEETRQNLKSHGFRWSPKNKAWQRQLTNNAEYALQRLNLVPQN